MKLSKVDFIVYSESDTDVRELHDELCDFVNESYTKGTPITATLLISAVRMIKRNPLILDII